MQNNILKEHFETIKIKIRQSRYETALEDINKILSSCPKSELAHYYKGVCELAMDKVEKAAKSYSNAIKINPAFAKAYFNLGVCFFTLGKMDKALINIGKALVIFSKVKNLSAKKRCIDALNLIQDERNR